MKKYKFKKYLFFIFIILILLSICFFLGNLFPSLSTNKVFDNSKEEGISNEEELHIKNILKRGLMEGRENFSFRKAIKSEEIFKFVFDVVRDEPEIMYFSNAEYKRGKLKIKYSQSKSKLKKDQVNLRLKRDEIISEIMDDSMTDYKKVIAAHDYIIDNSSYDCNINDDCKYKDESYTAYGNLVLGVGVCEGYAKSLKYLLDEVDLENLIIIGATKDHKHAWNLVKIDNEYYHIDLTWDDPITGGCEGVIHYTYCCLSDDEISKTHFWDREKYAEANGEYYNYFSYNDLVVENKDEFKERIKRALLKRSAKLLLKYENYKIDNVSLDSIMVDIEQKDNFLMPESFQYCIDDDQGVFNIYFNYYDKCCNFPN